MDSSHYEIFYLFTQRLLPYQPRALRESEEGAQPQLAHGLWAPKSLGVDFGFTTTSWGPRQVPNPPNLGLLTHSNYAHLTDIFRVMVRVKWDNMSKACGRATGVASTQDVIGREGAIGRLWWNRTIDKSREKHILQWKEAAGWLKMFLEPTMADRLWISYSSVPHAFPKVSWGKGSAYLAQTELNLQTRQDFRLNIHQYFIPLKYLHLLFFIFNTKWNI